MTSDAAAPARAAAPSRFATMRLVSSLMPGDVATRPVEAGDQTALTGSSPSRRRSGSSRWRLGCERRAVAATATITSPGGGPDRPPAPAVDRNGRRAQRYSIATFWPSTIAALLQALPECFDAGARSRSGDRLLRKPITGIAGCCARAASGHAAAAPPSSVMNSRRFIRSPRRRGRAASAGLSRPSALAVLRLMTSSNLVGCIDRQVGGLGALENPAGVDADLAIGDPRGSAP